MVTVTKRMLPRLELIKLLAAAPALGGRTHAPASAAAATTSSASATGAPTPAKAAAAQAPAPVPPTAAAFVDGQREGSSAAGSAEQRPQYPASLPLPQPPPTR